MKKRTHFCGELRLQHEGQEVVLKGWVRSVRNFGGCIFIDLRDREGIVQVVFRPDVVNLETMEKASSLKPESVVEICGKVISRGENANPKMKTGQIEVLAQLVEVLSTSLTPPFPIEDEINALETTRLTYRYLDLRRPSLQKNFLLRSRAMKIVYDYFYERGFVQVETPFLTRSTPEGARDFLVPSRMEPGSFYALPQSPQLFKQLLMIAGYDRYFQIVRCFRDEDLRADRQPEFTQIDIEMSFIEPEDIMELINGLLVKLVQEITGKEMKIPEVITYDEAIKRFGVDNPDTRFGMELVDLSEVIKNSGMEMIDRCLAEGGRVVGIKVEKMAFSRKEIDEFGEFVKYYGAKGLLWLKRGEGSEWSGNAKKLSPLTLTEIERVAEISGGDAIFFVADKPAVARTAMGRLRTEIANRTGLIKEGTFKGVWVKDFPLFEWNEQEKRWTSMHHPFTSPREEDIEKLENNPEVCRARSYDIVLNGQEVGGGSIRIHRQDLQEKIFSVLGISQEEAKEKFGFLLQALSYGAPPHGGIALGFDRLVAILVGAKSLRDVIAFPKTTSASCLMTGSPAPVSKMQLEELGLELLKRSKN